MRARHNLGLIYWKQGKLDKAIREFEELLKRNQSDNQGIRFLIGGAYHLRGEIRKALKLYQQAEKRWSGPLDPDVEFNLGLALYQLRRHKVAIYQWRVAFFLNLYIPQVVLYGKVELLPIWHGSNLAEPESALSYWQRYSPLWVRRPAAKRFLHLLFADSQVQSDLSYFIALRKALDAEQDFERRNELVEQERKLTNRSRIADTNGEVAQRVLSKYSGGER